MIFNRAYTAMAMGIALMFTSFNHGFVVSGFSFPHQSSLCHGGNTMMPPRTVRFSTLIDETTSTTSDNANDKKNNGDINMSTIAMTEGPTAWECDEEAECVEVPACDEVNCRTSLDVRIHGQWYDLSGE